MKKNLFLLFSLFLILGSVLVSCEDDVYYTVSFKGAGNIASQLVPRGGKAVEPSVSLQKEGFVFDGWSLDGDDYNFDSAVARDITLVAKWAVRLTVTFDTGEGGTEMDPVLVDYYGKLDEPETVPTRKGYDFVRWTTEENGTMEYHFGVPVYESFTLIAVWKAKEVGVKYDANGGTVERRNGELPGVQLVEYGKTVTVSSVSSSVLRKTGSVLEGWTTTKNGSGTVYSAGDEITVTDEDSMTLYAKWTSPRYSVWGDQGPSGGLIIYDCDEDNESGNADGLESSVCGWRYIEAAPDPLSGSYSYGYYRYNNTSSENHAIGATDEGIGGGRTNTLKAVNTLQNSAHLEKTPTTERVTDKDGKSVDALVNPEGVYAHWVCYDYSMHNGAMTFDDWYLPSLGEFSELFESHKDSVYGRVHLKSGRYITSTEIDGEKAWTCVAIINEEIGYQYSECQGERETAYIVFPIRYF